MSTWTNDDGLPVRFGLDQGKREGRAGVTTGAGRERELVMEIELTGAARTIFPSDTDNDGTVDGFTGLATPLPSGAKVVRQEVVNVVTPAGGTNYAIGTYQADGTVDDADGIRTTAGADGAQVGVALSADRHVTAVTTGTYTAGKVKVIVTYVV